MAVHGPIGEALFQTDTGLVILRPGYRVRQFLAALDFRQKPIEEVWLRAYLNPAQIELFKLMSVSEQRHAFAVLRTLQKEGYCEDALAQAALLHDVGKADGRVRLWHRVVAVLLQAICPALLHHLALNEPRSWRYPFFIQLNHAAIGAQMAARASTNALAVALIRWHHSTPGENNLDVHGQALLTALRSADEGN